MVMERQGLAPTQSREPTFSEMNGLGATASGGRRSSWWLHELSSAAHWTVHTMHSLGLFQMQVTETWLAEAKGIYWLLAENSEGSLQV